MQEGDSLVPPSIENLTFLHFFCRTSKEILDIYTKRDVEVKSDQIEMLEVWKKGLRQIYELMKEVNCTLLQMEGNREFKCPNMDTFFNFIIFTFESLIRIKRITRRDIATHTELKLNFDSIRLRKEKILTYIVDTQDKVRREEPIRYYDLYLMIIGDITSKEVAKSLEYVNLRIHSLKASCIARKFLYDNQKLTEAVKSLALIAESYHLIPENKRKEINIIQVEKEMAKLLKILGQEEYAAKIYIKNREFEFAHKAYQMAEVALVGDKNSKAKKQIEWGHHFEKDFHFDLALHYYRKAFSFADSVLLKQQALKRQLKCQEKMRNGPSEEELRMHLNFLEDGELLIYTNENNLS